MWLASLDLGSEYKKKKYLTHHNLSKTTKLILHDSVLQEVCIKTIMIEIDRERLTDIDR